MKQIKEMFQRSLCFIVLSFLTSVVECNPSCQNPIPGMINVHLVCHTHDDVGWLKTVDQYYYGSEKRIVWVGVQYIIDSVIPALLKDPSRKFIYVESAFFYRWWVEQDEVTQATIEKLIRNGQFEFINGGWCMNDEAAAHYNAIIDQMTVGLSWLNKTFGSNVFPRVAWQIDPFGHSREQASLFAQMGFDGLFFGRLDFDDKTNRWKKKEMEMIWKGDKSLEGDSSWLFTGVLPNGYSPPKGFCFDLLCPDDPIMDDPNLEDYNKEAKVDLFLKEVKRQQEGYATSNLIMTMGEDFNYVYADSWYKNLDKLIKYVNERQLNGSKVNVMYSTPSCYLDALHAENMTWPTKEDDFFPYASDPHAFWTGYFTSRPSLKGFIRKSNNILQAVKQIASLSGFGRVESLEALSKAMAVAQHHDAVTGTAKQHVTDDYSKRLSQGLADAHEVFSKGIKILNNLSTLSSEEASFHSCPFLNISSCPFTETTESFVVMVYNPIGRPRSYYVRVPVTQKLNYSVKNQIGEDVESQLVPLPSALEKVPGRESKAKYDLVFYAKDLPPLGIDTFTIQSKAASLKTKEHVNRIFTRSLKDAIISKGKLSIKLDAKTKMLKSILVKTGQQLQELKIKQDWLWYYGMAGDNSNFEKRASGAYIFRPNGTAKEFSSKVKNTAIHDGPLVAEVHQEWSPWVTQVLRLYKEKNYIEMEWLVGPIPIEDGVGKEIVNRVTWLDMETNNTFYTDANGRQMVKRIKDSRETWNLNSSEPVSQNYYPVTSRIIIKSSNSQGESALLNDRAQGGTSLADGELELMVHRRLLDDDAFGVGEALNETAYGKGLVVRGKHMLIHSLFDDPDCNFACQHRTLGEEMLLEPILLFSAKMDDDRGNPISSKKSGLTKSLPANMHLLTLEPWLPDQWLLRLENFYEKGEVVEQNETVTIDLKNMFSGWLITDVAETTLAANKLKKDDHRLHWKTKTESKEPKTFKSFLADTPDLFSFKPMQIRSFIVTVQKK